MGNGTRNHHRPPVIAATRNRFIAGPPCSRRHEPARIADYDCGRSNKSLVGWVKRNSLRSEPLGLIGKGYGIGRGILGMRRRSGGAWTRCPHEFALHAQAGEERGEVGLVRKETPFESKETLGDFTVIDLWANWIVLESQSKLMVPTEALASCKTQ